MSNFPLITTVMPTYRRPTLLKRAIRSVLQQTYPSLRVCVYDNASEDETQSVVAELAKADPRVHYHCHSGNIGALRNFQYGMDHVSTPFFSLLQDDDVLLPDFYRVAMAGFEEYPQAFCSMCATLHVDERGKVWLVQGTDWRSGLYPPPQGLIALLNGQFPPPWTCFLLRREALDVTGPLDESIAAAPDYDFQFRLTALRPMVVSTRPGVIMVSHSAAQSTMTRHKLTWAKWKESARLTNKIAQDERIPEKARDYFRTLRTVGIPKTLFRTYWLKGTLSGNWRLAYRAAVVYRAHGFGFRARLLTVLNKVIRSVPLGRRLLAALHGFVLWVRHRRPSQASYHSEDYSRFLAVEPPAELAQDHADPGKNVGRESMIK